MRKDQFEKLQGMSEKLTDVILVEVDCDNWPGANLPIEEHDKTIRGDRYWCKKNAVATVALAIRISTLVDIGKKNNTNLVGNPAAIKETEDDFDKEFKDIQKEATTLMKQLTNADAKKQFDAKLHGKA